MKAAARSSNLLLATVAALVVGTGMPTVPASSASPAGHQCSSAQLRLKFLDLQAVTGYRFIDYAFNNVGSATCSLRGYPGATLVNQRSHSIHLAQASVGQWPLSQLRTVAISPGQRAFFVFTWVDGAFCPGHSFTLYGLELFPPHEATGFPWHLGKTLACDNSAMVSAVRPALFPF